MNRETWLTEAALRLEAELFKPLNKSLPEKWRVSWSWPASRASGKGKAGTIGQCFDPSASSDETSEMLISMSQDEPLEVLAILAHEMVHAIEGNDAGHGPKFRKTALAIGLTGKMTNTRPGEAFKHDVTPIIEKLGEYPHAALDLNKRKKQGTRMVKMQCNSCGYIARTTKTNITNYGPTICPCNHQPMETK